MQTARKRCDICLQDSFIWKNFEKKKYCLNCWNKTHPPKPLKRLSIKPSTGIIRKVSVKRIDDLRRYKRLREKYFLDHPTCEFPGCTKKVEDLHHLKGRQGSFLTNKKYFCSLCRNHHEWVHNNDKEARKLGLLLSRIGND